MPKHIIEFNLPEETDEMHTALNAGKTEHKIHQFKEWLRAETKHRADNYTEQQYETLERIRDKFYEIISEE